MHITGIVTEYNPFHNGHAYQIAKVRELTGCDAVVVAMSGDFVQRGTPAIIDKALRTKMALLNGADVVLQIPVCYSTASAEAFAYGSVALLASAGIDTLAFGCETQNEQLLYELANLYLTQPPEYKQALISSLKSGMSFPAARSQATIEYYRTGVPTAFKDFDEIQHFLLQPNNILGIEYIKALTRLQQEGQLSHPIKTLAIPRIGSDHHSLKKEGTICSASAIRQALYENNTLPEKESEEISGWQSFLPNCCIPILNKYLAQYPPVHEDDFSSQLGYCLLQKKVSGFTSFFDVTPDISNRIVNHLHDYHGFSRFCSLLQTKECTYTGISRLLLHILLQIDNRRMGLLGRQPVPYIRVLGFRKDAIQVLSYIDSLDTPPLITNVKNAEELLSPQAYEILTIDLFARELYLMNLSTKSFSPQADTFHKPDNDYQLLVII